MLFFLPKLLREKRFLFICFALVLAFGMSLSLLTPMLTYFHQGIDTSNMSTLMSDNTLSLGNLLGFEAVNPYYWLKHSRSIGLPLILSNICLLPFLFSQHSSGEKHIAVFSLAAGIILCFMTTRLFPWQLLSIHTNGATDIYQFPYRFLGYADVLLAISGSYALSRTALFISSKRPSTSRIFSVCLIILCFVLGLTEAYPIFDKTFHDQKQYKKGDPFFDRFTPPDYILTGTDIDLTDDNTPSAGQGLHISSYRKYGTTTAIDIHAETQTYISLPVFAFDGYSAKLNGKILPIQSGINNRITIPIDASSEGTLLVSFSGKSVWKLADLCSLAFFILTLFFLHKHRNCIPRKI